MGRRGGHVHLCNAVSVSLHYEKQIQCVNLVQIGYHHRHHRNKSCSRHSIAERLAFSNNHTHTHTHTLTHSKCAYEQSQ